MTGDYESRRKFLNDLGVSFPANEGGIDPRHDEEKADERYFIGENIRIFLMRLKEANCDLTLVREEWTTVLLQKLIPSNPYREPMDERAVYSDWMFMEMLVDRIEKIMHDYDAGWKRAPRSFDKHGYFPQE